jgi:ActR/RegA family two-component response regulator
MSKIKSGKPLNVLIIDDDSSFVVGLQRDANDPRFRIRLDHATNLEDGLLKLQERGEKYFAGVILDVICLKDRKQQIPDPSFISKAMEEFNRRAPSLPKVILTGEPTRAESLKPIFAGNTSVYHKSAEQIEEMLAYLVKQSESQLRQKFAKKYPDIFSIFDDGYLGANEEQALVSCLEKLDHYEATVISDNLGRLRKLQEAIYLAINKINPNIVPMGCIEKNGPNCRSIMRHLKTKQYVEESKIIDRFSDSIYSISSDYGVHVPNTRPEYPPTRYTVQALTFAMLDQLLWFKSIIGDATSK